MKTDLLNFKANEMTAKLYCIMSEYNRQYSELITDRKLFDNWVLKQVQQRFVYPKKHEQKTVIHLQLYLLGNDDNMFSKALKNNPLHNLVDTAINSINS